MPSHSYLIYLVDLVSDNLRKVINLLLDVASKWYELGLQLGVKESYLKSIEHDYGHRGAQTCLREMLSVWLKMIDPRPSWESLLSSVRHSTVGNPALAQKIRKEVGMPENAEGLSSARPSKQAGRFAIRTSRAASPWP